MCLPGTLIVGYEGVWGCLVMLFIVFPLMQFVIPGNDVGGVQENTYDTIVMIENSHAITMMTCVYLFSCCTYNVARMLVTSNLSAVHFTMIDASRTAVVWVLNLFLRYHSGCGSWFCDTLGESLSAEMCATKAGFGKYGEEWTSYSPLQAVGFVILLTGQCIYGDLLHLPFEFLYKQPSGTIAKLQRAAKLAGNASSPQYQGMSEAEKAKEILGVLGASAKDDEDGVNTNNNTARQLQSWRVAAISQDILTMPASRHMATPLPPYSPLAHTEFAEQFGGVGNASKFDIGARGVDGLKSLQARGELPGDIFEQMTRLCTPGGGPDAGRRGEYLRQQGVGGAFSNVASPGFAAGVPAAMPAKPVFHAADSGEDTKENPFELVVD